MTVVTNMQKSEHTPVPAISGFPWTIGQAEQLSGLSPGAELGTAEAVTKEAVVELFDISLILLQFLKRNAQGKEIL